ncbi:uncharacterized protein LOC143742518 [Siphateles boraxobius]|uniref:uncharacterized protein LOC143742518 n=1 Tax=Siphateles boraxobius TaxID=180520 RepID=UPI004063A651
MRFMLIQWIEDHPTWDVLPTEKIINGRCEIGGVCDVQYKEESSPAKILNIGTRSAMLKQLHSIEKNQSIKKSRPEGNEELRRGQGQKYSRILSESESTEEYESVSKQVSEKRVKRMRAKSFLQQYNLEKFSQDSYFQSTHSLQRIHWNQAGRQQHQQGQGMTVESINKFWPN